MQTSGKETAMRPSLSSWMSEMKADAWGRAAESVYPTVMASEAGDRLQVTHVATETAATRGDESPISVLL